MSENSRSPASGPFPTLPALAIMLIVAAVALRLPPLESSRPVHEPLPTLGSARAERARARLWQDPLQAVYTEHQKRVKERRKGDLTEIKDVLRGIHDSLSNSASQRENPSDWRFNLKIKRHDRNARPRNVARRRKRANRATGSASLSALEGRDVERWLKNNVWARQVLDFLQGAQNASDDKSISRFAQNLTKLIHHVVAVELKARVKEATPRSMVEEVTDGNLLLLSVLLQGGPYPEDAENRMRTRYAVLSALGQAGYKPDQSERINYVTLEELRQHLQRSCAGEEAKRRGSGDPATVAQSKRTFLIPFERFEYTRIVPQRASNFTPVYVVWLDEEALQDADNVASDVDPVFAWRLNRTLAMFERWLVDSRRMQFKERVTTDVLARIRPWYRKEVWPRLRSTIRQAIGQQLDERLHELWDPRPPTQFHVVGPVSSDSLLKIYSAGKPEPPYLCDRSPLPHLRVFSPWATVAGPILKNLETIPHELAMPGSPPMQRETSNTDKDPSHFSIFRMTATDDQLAIALLQELELREASPVRPPDTENGQDQSIQIRHENHMAIIGEWDTLYGRAWHCTFLNEMKYFGLEHSHGYVCNDRVIQDPTDNIHFISYLRGLDGRLPVEGEVSDPSKRTDESEQRYATAPLPTGQAQLDYLRRLQQHLRRIEEEHSRAGELKAIGILGSDVYDKLLILRALRPHFPGAVFFTTDLDARMAHPTEYEHTRNLIVASPYGLSLDHDLQRGVPPFRDSYQTAMYLTTLYAIGDEVATARLETSSSAGQGVTGGPGSRLRLPAPRVFEIGRSGAYDLSTHPANPSYEVPQGHDGQPNRIHPMSRRERCLNDLPGILARGALGLFAIGWLIYSAVAVLYRSTEAPETVRNSDPKDHNRAAARVSMVLKWLGRIGLPVLVLVTFLAALESSFRSITFGWITDLAARIHEPLTPFEGISAWPTEILRLTAASVSLVFLCSIWRQLKQDKRVIEGTQLHEHVQMVVNSNSAHESAASRLKSVGLSMRLFRLRRYRWRRFKVRFARLRRFIDALRARWPLAHTVKDVGDLWHEYMRLGQKRYRMARSVFQALLYYAFGAVLLNIFGYPASPVRGHLSIKIDVALLVISVAALLLLVFFVLDATRLCGGFFQQLAEHRGYWKRPAAGDAGTGPTTHHEPGQEAPSDAAATDVDELMEEQRGDLKKMRLIASHSETIGRSIKYPFIVLFIMILSRHPVFDNWDWPVGLVIIFLLLALAILCCTWLLRRSARHARREILDLLARERDGLLLPSLAPDSTSDRLKRIDTVIGEIKAIRRGAFSPVSESPILGAPLIPAGLYGLTELVSILGYRLTGSLG